jgi:hypothetical protein
MAKFYICTWHASIQILVKHYIHDEDSITPINTKNDSVQVFLTSKITPIHEEIRKQMKFPQHDWGRPARGTRPGAPGQGAWGRRFNSAQPDYYKTK